MRFSSSGRGRHYGATRGLIELALGVLYRGDWPRALWERVPGACTVRSVHHTVPLLAPGSPSVRAAFVSDLHLGPTTPPRLLDRAFDRLRESAPDLLLLGGDYVFLDATPQKAKELARRVAGVPAKRTVAVWGNHDLWTRHDLLESSLRDAGVDVLVNGSTSLGDITVVALDDPWTGTMKADQAFAGTQPETATVVLCHSPDALPDVQRVLAATPRSAPALYVCGHTHGGHVAAPWGPLVVPGAVGKVYPAGFFDLGSVLLYVSRGVGGTELPVRTFAPPEVAVFDLVPRRA